MSQICPLPVLEGNLSDDTPFLRLGRIQLGSRANGPGLRDVFWVTGCTIGCPGCINPHFLDSGKGEQVAIDAVKDLVTRRRNEVEGITFSGGEPTEQALAVSQVATHAQSVGLSVVLFTGKSLQTLRRQPEGAALLEACDLVVAGPYVARLGQSGQPLLGSANQVLHFLSSRYQKADIEALPLFEIHLDPKSLSWTGLTL